MSEEPRLWAAIGDRLDRLASRDGEVRFWLRDDDAVRPTPALDRLLAAASRAGVPLALAVIPAEARPALAERLAPEAEVAVLQHGFSHANHAPPGGKKAELGDDRPADAVLSELDEGRQRLEAFPRVVPILVPPWNRIGPSVASRIGSLGFRALSLYGDRGRHSDAPGPRRFNAHVDLVDWGARRFHGRQAALLLFEKRLGDLLDGAADPTEPTGILSHHLVHDEATFIFLSDLLVYLAKRKRCRFLSAGGLLAMEAGRKAKMGE